MRIPESPLQPRALRIAAIVLCGLMLAVVVWWPMLKAYPGTPIEDGHYFFHQIEISKAAVRYYHEVPLWNPFDCRGIPMWDHPENITASPIFLLTLPFSSQVTVIVWHLAHVVVGFLGMWLLCRDEFRLSRSATFVAAMAWSFGTVHNQYAGEHMAFISFYHVPLLLYAWRRAEHSWDWAIGTGLLLALMVYDGATYPLPLTAVFLGLETLTRFTSLERARTLAARGAVVGLVGLLVGASRILPIQDQFAEHNRVLGPDVDHLARAKIWFDMYLLRSPHWRSHVEGQVYVLGEYQAYIGWLGLLMLVLGVVAAASETSWMLAVSAALVALMLGHFAEWAPWAYLHGHVPPFKSMRVPARFRLLLALPIAAYMGYAVDRVPAAVRRWLGSPQIADAARVALFAVGVFAAGDSAGLFTEILEYRFTDPPPADVKPSTRFYYGGPGLSPDFASQPRQNRAWLACRAAWAYTADAGVWMGDVPQARAVDDGATVEVANRTHNTFTIDVDVHRPSRVLVNSAYERGWQSDVGAVVEDHQLLALDLPVGRHHVHMRYWPRRLTLGLWLSALGLLGALAFLAREDVREVMRRARASVRRSGG
jgi:hypothetical protein